MISLIADRYASFQFHEAHTVPTIMGESPLILPHRKADERLPHCPDSSDPSASMILPPEMLDKIMEYIPTNRFKEGRPTLMACALVATWWTEPSQRRLFSLAVISERNHEGWVNGVAHSGSKTRLLGYVRRLWLYRGQNFKGEYRMRNLAQDSGEYLSALYNLRSLTVQNVWVEHIGEEGFRSCFSAFRGTLTYLYLDFFSTSFSTFVTLVDYFPHLRTLLLRSLVLRADERPVPTLSRPLRGKVHIHVQLNHLKFFDRLGELDPEYEELVIDSFYDRVEKSALERILQLCPRTVKFLRFLPQLPREYSLPHSSSNPRTHPRPRAQDGAPLTISNFQQLQELQLTVELPNSAHEVLLSSITSTKLRKIIFLASYMHKFFLFTREWALFDEQLCQLMDRLRPTGYHHTLEAELRLTEIRRDFDQCDFTMFLPKFREKGIVTIVDAVDGNRLLHSSTHSC